MLPCSACGAEKPDDEFYAARRNVGRRGRHSWCKACTAEAQRRRRRENPDAARALGRRHARVKRLRRYGLTMGAYEALLAEQGDVCAICGRPEMTQPSLAIDHDHLTGRVRGLLCFACNTGIGKLGDNPALLRKAAAYLEQA